MSDPTPNQRIMRIVRDSVLPRAALSIGPTGKRWLVRSDIIELAAREIERDGDAALAEKIRNKPQQFSNTLIQLAKPKNKCLRKVEPPEGDQWLRTEKPSEKSGEDVYEVNDEGGLDAIEPMEANVDSRGVQGARNEALLIVRDHLRGLGLSYEDELLAAFLTAMRTKGFVLLSGISGTGKTKLAQALAECLPKPAESKPRENWLFTPVRPDWRDSRSLFGFDNPLLQPGESYQATPFVDFVRKAVDDFENDARRPASAWVVLLDEMNLAHVEHYFADFLSCLESGWSAEGFRKEAVPLSESSELRIPPNLYIVGTVNIDETTFAFSPKVLDRAFTFILEHVDFNDYPAGRDDPAKSLDDAGRQRVLEALRGEEQPGFVNIRKDRIAAYVDREPGVRERLQRLNRDILTPHGLQFGYRIFDEVVAFLDSAEESGLFDGLRDEAAFDWAITTKVLPRLRGSRARLKEPLEQILAWCVAPDGASTSPDPVLRESHALVLRLLGLLKSEGYASLC